VPDKSNGIIVMYSLEVKINQGTFILDSAHFVGDWQAYTKADKLHITFDLECDLFSFNEAYNLIKDVI